MFLHSVFLFYDGYCYTVPVKAFVSHVFLEVITINREFQFDISLSKSKIVQTGSTHFCSLHFSNLNVEVFFCSYYLNFVFYGVI